MSFSLSSKIPILSCFRTKIYSTHLLVYFTYNKSSTSEAILTGQVSKPKRPEAIRSDSKRFEARMAASVSNSDLGKHVFARDRTGDLLCVRQM